MLTVIRDAEGHLEAACEWHLVNEQGMRVGDGRYVYVDDLHISAGQPRLSVIRSLIQRIAEEAPEAVGAYWERWQKYGEAKLHAFRRDQLVQREEVVA